MSLTWEYLGKTNLKKLSAAQKRLYDGLPLMMAATEIGYLCRETADEFCRRCNACQFGNRPLTVNDLRPFFGLRTNVQTVSSYEWALRHMGVRGNVPIESNGDLQPHRLQETILKALERIDGQDVWHGERYEGFRRDLHAIVQAYSRGIVKMPWGEDTFGSKWVNLVEKLAGSRANEMRYTDILQATKKA